MLKPSIFLFLILIIQDTFTKFSKMAWLLKSKRLVCLLLLISFQALLADEHDHIVRSITTHFYQVNKKLFIEITFIQVRKKRRSSSMGEHSRPVPQPSRDLSVFLAALLRRAQALNQPLSRNPRRESAWS